MQDLTPMLLSQIGHKRPQDLPSVFGECFEFQLRQIILDNQISAVYDCCR